MKNSVFIILIFLSTTIVAQDPIPIVDLAQMKYGLKDSLSNEVVLPPTYDYITSFYQGYAIVRNGRSYGLINTDGQEVLPMNYQEFKRISSAYYRIKQNGKFGLLKSNTSKALPIVFNALEVTEESVLVHNGEYWGVIDLAGNIQLPFQYDSVIIERSNLGQTYLNPDFIRVLKNGSMGAVSIQNEPVIPLDWQVQEISRWNDSIVWVKNEKEAEALLSFDRDTILGFDKFERISPIMNGYFAVAKEGKYGFMNQKFEMTIPFRYERVLSFHNGRATVKQNGCWGVINRAGDTLIPFMSADPIVYKNGLAVIQSTTDHKSTLINYNRQPLNRLRFDEIIIESELVLAKSGEFWGALNKKGLMIIPFEYDEIMLKRGYVVVVKDHLQGLFNTKGKRILKPAFEFIYPTFDDPFIMVRKEGKYGYVNLEGKIVIPIRYENARNFRYGRATVLLNEKSYEINRKGGYFGAKDKQ